MCNRYETVRNNCQKCGAYEVLISSDITTKEYEFLEGEECEHCGDVLCNNCFESHDCKKEKETYHNLYSLLRELSRYATRWVIEEYIIEERWNPQNNFSIEYNHPDKDKRLFCIGWYVTGLGVINEVYSREKNCFIIEPKPSERSDEFIQDTRFILEEAYNIVKRLRNEVCKNE